MDAHVTEVDIDTIPRLKQNQVTKPEEKKWKRVYVG